MEHFLSDPESLTRDLTECMAFLYPDQFQTLPSSYNGRVLLRRDYDPSRVNVIVSNGGGCYPLSPAYVGLHMADASVSGNMRAAPSAYDIYEAAKAISSPKGCLLIYNHFMGDYLNNDMAEELIRLDGLKSRQIAVKDDCLSVTCGGPRSERTGLSGILYLIKIAASCAEQGLSLDETYEIVEHANSRMATVTVTLDFEKELLCLGAGFSGEPPVHTYSDRFSLEKSAETVYRTLVNDLEPQKNEKLHLMVSRMDKTRPEDSYLFAKAVCMHSLTDVPIHRTNVGYYTGLLNDYGYFVTLLCADEILEPHLSHTFFSDCFRF